MATEENNIPALSTTTTTTTSTKMSEQDNKSLPIWGYSMLEKLWFQFPSTNITVTYYWLLWAGGWNSLWKSKLLESFGVDLQLHGVRKPSINGFVIQISVVISNPKFQNLVVFRIYKLTSNEIFQNYYINHIQSTWSPLSYMCM